MSGFKKLERLDIKGPITNRHLCDAINLQADGYNQLHDCVHDVGKRVDGVATIAQSTALDVARIQGAMGIRAANDANMSAGEPPKPVKRKLAGITVWQALGALGGVQIVFQWILPAVIKAFPSWAASMGMFFAALMAP